MKAEDSMRLAVRFGIVALFVLTAGCSSSAWSPTAPTAVAFQKQHQAAGATAQSGQRLYISTVDGKSVLVYSAGANPSLLQTITDGLTRPGSVSVDKHGALYALNQPDQSYQASLPEYKSRASVPFKTITNGIVNVDTVAVDNDGNVYVTGIDNSNESLFLEIYPKGKLNPSETLTIPRAGPAGLTRTGGLAFDSSGALIVGESLFGKVKGAFYRLPAGSQTFTRLHILKAPGGIIALDGAGNVYAAGDDSIAVYAPNSPDPSRTIKVRVGVIALTVASNGELYVGTQKGVSEYAPGAREPSTTINFLGHIGGLALSP